MEQFKVTGSLFKCLVLAGLLTSCNNDQVVTPADQTSSVAGDQNAKINAALKLVKYGNDGIQYVKSGKFVGLVSRVSNASSYKKYTYNDNNGTTNLFITCEQYSKATNVKYAERVFEIANGRCIASKASDGSTYEYKYNASGLLEQATFFYQNSWVKSDYSYIFNAPTNTYRLDKVVSANNNGPVQEKKITYTAIPDKYGLLPENIDAEPMLPFFGKFSDVLIKDQEENSLTGIQWTHFREFSYVLDNSGYVTFRTQIYHPFGKGSNASLSTFVLDYKYSQNWQGI